MPRQTDVPVAFVDQVLAEICGKPAAKIDRVRTEPKPVRRNGGNGHKMPDLGLWSDKSFVIDGKKVPIPVDVGEMLTAEQVKAIGNVYRGKIVFMRVNGGWQRLNDGEAVTVTDDPQIKTEDKPKPVQPAHHPEEFRSTPHYNTD